MLFLEGVIEFSHFCLPIIPQSDRLYGNGSYAIENGNLKLRAGEKVSLDSYFNSFFELNLRQSLPFSKAGVKIKAASGGALLRVYRKLPGHPPEEILWHPVTTIESVCTFEIPYFSDRLGRVFCEIQNDTKEDFILESGSWLIDRVPQRRVGLGIIFTTFQREKYITRNLELLCRSEILSPFLNRIWVIDNGQTLKASDLPSDPRITLLGQSNVGGSGGFCRGLLEANGDGTITHTLLMDDDVQLSDESIYRAIRLASLTTDDKPIAGAMLDETRPHHVFEQGAVLEGIDIRRTEWSAESSLDQLTLPWKAEYGAWWFFLVSKALVEKAGLPAPFFFQCDDQEYGLRLLKMANVNPLCLPGIGVWHQPFHLKMDSWSKYFYFRNVFITNAIHRKKIFVPLLQFFKYTFSPLCRFDYASVWVKLRGLQDFLRGPGWLEQQSPVALHREITSQFQSLRSESEALFQRKVTAGRPSKDVGRIPPPILLLGRENIRLFYPEHPKPVLLSRDWKLSFLLLGKILAASMRFVLSAYRLNRAYERRLPHMTSKEYWTEYLGLAGAAS